MILSSEVERPGLQPGRSASSDRPAWRNNDMSSINHTRPVLQFRCRVEVSGIRYEQIIPGAGGVNNYHSVDQMVVGTAWNDFYRKPEAVQCESLTAGSPMGEAYQCGLSVGSQKPTGLSTFGPITNMVSASVLSASSSATFGK